MALHLAFITPNALSITDRALEWCWLYRASTGLLTGFEESDGLGQTQIPSITEDDKASWRIQLLCVQGAILQNSRVVHRAGVSCEYVQESATVITARLELN